MLETLIFTLKDGIELVLLSWILFGFIYKIRQKRLNLFGYGALILALPFSILLAYSLVNLTIEKEIETFFAFSGFILTLLMTIWIWWQSFSYNKSLVQQEKKIIRKSSLLSKVLVSLFILYLGIKFETKLILFPKQIKINSMLSTTFNTELLLKYCGGIIGIGLALSFGFILIKAHKKMNFKQSRNLVAVLYLVSLIRLAILGLYGLMLKGVISVTPEFISLLAPFYNNINKFFYIFLAVITVGLTIIAFKKEDRTLDKNLNPAQQRNVKAQIRNKDRWIRASVVAVIFFIALLGLNYFYANGTVQLVPAIALEPEADEFVIAKKDLADGKLHRYSYETKQGTIIKFFLIKKAKDAYGVVHDACEICGSAGYYQKDDQVICANCDVVMNKLTIGFPGGCNPIPMKYKSDKQRIKIKVNELLKREGLFS
ncbi:DUF2318 domain-containing protein [Selenihalanaerobacter shriftii]|uniref:Uncharacterized membrane protein n=1 Tax=Selenihalanaerobacter shriftii TaxID=142842 RepID=A0A1T4L2T2_9FIRM|nr:DUF2318 domain-containing protein [Selenihalanaerobacter shriftii]SJZ49029.1 Uncharacterized membrane protein [Selenihalanaerobacter shriftii]